MNIHFEQITIIGVGLIGGSFARVCKKKGLVDRAVGYGRGEANLKKGVELGVIDSYSLNLKEAVQGADLIMLSPSVDAIINIAEEMLPFLKPGVIVTDAGSVKGEIVRRLEKVFPKDIHFVGGHPIAGTEKGGVEASFDTLFEGARCIITPTKKTDGESLEKIKGLWQEIGSIVMEMGAEEHDLLMGGISHLPHIAAYALVNAVSNIPADKDKLRGLSAGGFKDITRIASSSPGLWREISMMNRDTLLKLIADYREILEAMEKDIREGRGESLEEGFAKAKVFRDSIQG
ncbi:MAG: prephenate dehydrogenase/arogenate dehydrogenase family protein [Nitrospinae bacterium]|nr:prephenate dehydrogenase/arogenate dehydrogenase family protein [Nitrospinota bacterium]